MTQLVALGGSAVRVSPLGIGTWQWGDRLMWGYGNGDYTDADLRAAFESTFDAGVNWFDTAEVYGQGRSERLLGEFVGASGRPVLVATKFMPLPWRVRRDSLLKALRRSLDRLGLPRVDLYQVHWPFPPRSIETWAEALADVVEAGLARAVGVSNFNVDQTRRAHAVLAKRGVPLASNQVEYSLLQRRPEHNGLLAACRDLNVSVIAYSPIGKGVLSGKYTPGHRPSGLRRRRWSDRNLAQVQPLVEQIRRIGEGHDGKTPVQVALNWVMCKSALSIPGVKNPRQVQDVLGALGWSLTPEEVAALDRVAEQGPSS